LRPGVGDIKDRVMYGPAKCNVIATSAAAAAAVTSEQLQPADVAVN